MCYSIKAQYALVAELADASDSKSDSLTGNVGSNPTKSTELHIKENFDNVTHVDIANRVC